MDGGINSKQGASLVSARSRGLWIAGPLCAVLIVGGLITARVLGPAVAAVPVERREIVQKVVVSGRVLPTSRIPIGSMLAGVVTQVGVKEGDHVRPGDLLVQLDDTEARAAVALARAGLQQARARLGQLKHVTGPVAREAHRQADANLELARLSYERQALLHKKGSLPPAQLDEAKRALDVAQSQHEATETQAASAGPRGAEHRLALAAYAQAAASVAQAEVRVAESRITAVTQAVVLTRSAEPGELVQPGRTLMVLARDGETLLSVQPDEKNLAELRLGQPARASADAFPREAFAAAISYIAPSVDPQRGTIEVRLLVPQPPPYLKPDMTVSVNIEVGRRPDARVVPREAVQDLASSAPWVWRLDGGRAERRGVELGLRGEGHVEIVRGLQDGDRVLVPGGANLRPGQRVRAKKSGS